MKSIFVSSTFRDMHFERDVLNRRITPKINRQLAQCNQSVRLLDLRWGVDTSDLSEREASQRVLDACNNAIDNCKPYIIVLLGDRYGYIPSESDISVTHMEIIRGVINSLDREHAYIYMRDADYSGMPDHLKSTYVEQDKTSAEHLDKLKALLLETMPERCRRYKSVWSEEKSCLVSEDFENLIIADLEDDIVKDNSLIRYRSDLEKQLSENEEILLDNLKYAYFNEDQIRSHVEALKSSEEPTGILGEGGSGKSVYMSLLCSALRKEGFKASILFCGDNAFSASVRNAAEALLCAIYDACGKDYDYETCASLSYDDIIARISDERDEIKTKFYFMLDAVEKCDEGMLDFVYWCGGFLSDKVHVVFSSRMTDAIKEKKKSFILCEIYYERDDYRKMAECILNKNAKGLNSSLIEAVIDKSRSPLQLQLNIVRLLNLDQKDFNAIQESGGGMDAINAYLKQIIDGTPDDLGNAVLEYLDKLITESDNPKFHVFMLNVLAFCEYGLSEDDMHTIFDFGEHDWVELDYIYFLERFSFFIRTRDNGRLDISHDVIRSILKDIFERNSTFICAIICMHYLHKDQQDTISVRSFFEAAFNGMQLRPLVEFFVKHKNCLQFSDSKEMALGSDIRSCIRRMFFKDQGELLLNCITKCKSIEEIAALHSMIGSSLLSIDDYYPEEVIEQIAYTAIMIPLHVKVMAGTVLEMEKSLCLSFLQRHNVSEKKINEFLAFCDKKEAELSHESKPKNTGNAEQSYEEALDDLRSSDSLEMTLKFSKLSSAAKDMSNHIQTAKDAEYILTELLSLLDKRVMEVDEDMYDLLYADIYTSLGGTYKTLKEWEKGIAADQKSLEIYERIYEKHTTAEMFEKYRSRVYNLANITEAWAMTEGDNVELWKRTAECFKKVYDLELIAISHGMPERLLVISASSILSYGMALIHAGNEDDGLERCREGAGILLDSAKNNADLHLYLQVCINIMDCVARMFRFGKHDAATELASDIYKYLRIIIEKGDAEIIKQVQHISLAFSNHANETIQLLHNRGDIYGQNAFSNVLFNIYKEILPVSPHEVKVNMIITKCNICASLFWEEKNYAEAYRQYRELLDMVVEKGLADPDENGKHESQANARLVDAYLRCVICLEKLERKEELDKLIDEAEMWGKFFAAHIDFMIGNLPSIFLEISKSLLNKKSPSGLIFLLKAFEAMHNEDFDAKTNSETVKEILTLMAQVMGASGTDGEDG